MDHRLSVLLLVIVLLALGSCQYDEHACALIIPGGHGGRHGRSSQFDHASHSFGGPPPPGHSANLDSGSSDTCITFDDTNCIK